MGRKWSGLKKLEAASLGVYLIWLALVIFLWGSERMLPNQVVTVFALLFAAVIYVLLCVIRRLPQIRMGKAGLTHRQTNKIIRLRYRWLAQLKLIFICGFAGMSLSLLYSEILRVILVVLFLLALLCSAARFAMQYWAVTKVAPPVPAEEESEIGKHGG